MKSQLTFLASPWQSGLVIWILSCSVLPVSVGAQTFNNVRGATGTTTVAPGPATGPAATAPSARFGNQPQQTPPPAPPYTPPITGPPPPSDMRSGPPKGDVFALILWNVQRIKNSEFGKLSTVAGRLAKIESAARRLQQFSVRRPIRGMYLSGLASDARALGRVADAVAGKHALWALPGAGWSIVSEKPFIAFLAPCPARHRAAPPDYQNQVLLQALGSDEKAQLIQSLDDVGFDLFDKESYAEKNSSDPFASVKIKVVTRNNSNKEVGGYKVCFSFATSFREGSEQKSFTRLSSPTDYPLPPGNYVFWARSVSKGGPQKRCTDVGYDGRPERSVDPLFTP
jgi:hypothetical protein